MGTKTVRPTQVGINRAAALLERGDVAGAEWLCHAMLARDARFLPARALLACALLARGTDCGAALVEAERALALAPNTATAHFVRGTALHALGRAAEAVPALQAAVRLAPGDAAAWLNLGNACATLDRMEEAEAALARACALDPHSAIAYASRGAALVQQLRLREAIGAYTTGLRLRPDLTEVHWDLGFARLLAGDFREGWAGFRQRKPEEEAVLMARGVAGAEWDGAAPEGLRLYACSTQGLGDAIQFARYLRMLAARGVRVMLGCDARLAPLLRRLDGIEVVMPDEPPPAFDAWVALSSLPRLFGTEEPTIPTPAGYLAADPSRVGVWRRRLPAGPVIGLVWAGNPAHTNDARRSMPSAALAPLLEVTGIRFVSLQVGGGAPPAGVADLAPLLTDMAETAAAVTALDLLITVDTAAAHLAGALGKPAWVALPYGPDWRWQLGRSDSPWYASLVLFRQPRPGDWGSVVAALAVGLRRLAGERAA